MNDHQHEWERGAHMAAFFDVDGRKYACAFCGTPKPPRPPAPTWPGSHREPNHYDWFLPDDPTAAVDEYLDDLEAKLQEALADFYVHDMAQAVLPLIAAYRRLRDGSLSEQDAALYAGQDGAS